MSSDLCLTFGKDNDILSNKSKSKLILFDTIKYGKHANILLYDNALDYVINFTFLGHLIDTKLNDKLDMKSKETTLYGRSNILIRKFCFCEAQTIFCLLQQYKGAAGRSITVAYNNVF